MDRALSQIAVLGLLGVQAADVRRMLVFVVCLVLATAVHEFAHAYTADRLGDPTPGREGRLTLNPLAHADPIGTIALPLFAGLTRAPLFGWGRPVNTQPRYYNRKVSMRGGMALVAFAGPLSNVLQALLVVLLAWGLVAAGINSSTHANLFGVLGLFFIMNITLAVFNLLPVHPLDGGKVLAWLLPSRAQGIDDFLAKWGWAILLALLLSPVLPMIFGPVFVLAAKVMALVDGRWFGTFLDLQGR
ncbi:site-2 protease family protein [Nannocystis pusilla]|uniref:site-2 protease family protein n=1 Tax=Nannocystis pusilla TaxID=889268 RepID=UPI003DA50D5F